MDFARTDALEAELLIATADWNDFDLVPQAQAEEVMRIGAALNEAGGLGAMLHAYYKAKHMNSAARVLNLYWDGIGIWQM